MKTNLGAAIRAQKYLEKIEKIKEETSESENDEVISEVCASCGEPANELSKKSSCDHMFCLGCFDELKCSVCDESED
jgi:formylmethanofuran dehydrogenase subunit E